MKTHINPFKFIFPIIGVVAVLLFILLTSINSKNKTDSIFLNYSSRTFKQSRLWQLINEYRIKANMPSFTESSNVCLMAVKRLSETKSDWSHNGFFSHVKDFPNTKIGENLIKGYASEDRTLQGWLNSPLHKKNLTDNYKYSCLRCESDRCVQVFASY